MDEKRKQLFKGIGMMICSSLMTCSGQLCWKLGTGQYALIFLLFGFALYGCGALLMIVALRYGELSVLHPMLSVGYVFSVVLGAIVLNEAVTARKLLGIAIIIIGLVLISKPDHKEGE